MEVFFKKGIPGFENLIRFKISEIENNEKFKIITSLEDSVSFIAICPFDVYEEYEIDLDDEIIKELEIKTPTDVLILSILTLGGTMEKTTMNLKAPIVINVNNNLGKQHILQCETYHTKHPLIRSEQNVSNY